MVASSFLYTTLLVTVLDYGWSGVIQLLIAVTLPSQMYSWVLTNRVLVYYCDPP